MSEGILNVTLSEEVSTTGVTEGNLELPLPPNLLTPRLYFLKRELIHWVDKTKNV